MKIFGNPFGGNFAVKQGDLIIANIVAVVEHNRQYVDVEVGVTENIPLIVAAVNVMIHEVIFFMFYAHL